MLCYSKEAPGCEILHKKHGHTRIECFLDADWARSKKIGDQPQDIVSLLEEI